MELAFLVWVISTLGNISGFAAVLACIAGAISLILVINRSLHNDYALYGQAPTTKPGWGWASIWAAVSVVIFMFVAIIPSQKTAYIMVAAYATQQVAEDPKVQELGAKTLKLIENKLDEYIKESEKAAVK